LEIQLASWKKELGGLCPVPTIANRKLVGIGFGNMCYQWFSISFKVVCKKKKEIETTINMFGMGK